MRTIAAAGLGLIFVIGRLAAQGGAPASALARADLPAVALAQAGDAGRGKALVASSGCFDCHRIGDKGSHLGPDLSDIGSRQGRTAEQLRRSIVAPDDEVAPADRFVRVVTKSGTTVTGHLLNQDAVSVQLMSPKEELKSYLRADLRELAILDKGLMPSSQGKLNEQQIADIVAYLLTLKEG